MSASILSFAERGPWGKSSWRGNCSGYIYRDLFQQLEPQSFIDPMVGSGTSVEVAQEMGIKSWGLDLHAGFNILRDSIVEAVGQEADLVFSHPPYHSMVVYSGAVWGSAHPDDLSRCESVDVFNEKLHMALLNQREATREGGYYGTLIGDLRKSGRYYSFQSELIARLPEDELAAVLIKGQHNTVSDRRQYRNFRMWRIAHEYILLWQKPRVVRVFLDALRIMHAQCKTRMHGTWKAVVRTAMVNLGGKAKLAELYEMIQRGAPEHLQRNPNWKAKVRQVLQRYEDFEPAQRGVWALA